MAQVFSLGGGSAAGGGDRGRAVRRVPLLQPTGFVYAILRGGVGWADPGGGGVLRDRRKHWHPPAAGGAPTGSSFRQEFGQCHGTPKTSPPHPKAPSCCGERSGPAETPPRLTSLETSTTRSSLLSPSLS